MKKNLLAVSALTIALAAGPALAAPADRSESPRQIKPQYIETREHSGNRHFARLARDLELSSEQQVQIRELRAAHRQEVKPLYRNLGEERREMRQLVKAEAFDESAARAIAARQAETRAGLVVEQARVGHQIRSVLTPEQQLLADQKRSRDQLERRPRAPQTSRR